MMMTMTKEVAIIPVKLMIGRGEMNNLSRLSWFSFVNSGIGWWMRTGNECLVLATANSDISCDVTGTVEHCFTGARGWQKAR